MASPVEQDVREEDDVTSRALDVLAFPVDLVPLKYFRVNLRGVTAVAVLLLPLTTCGRKKKVYTQKMKIHDIRFKTIFYFLLGFHIPRHLSDSC